MLTAVSVSATTLDDIRVHSVQSDVFEYKFTSVVSSRTPVTLAFNHTSGDTVFARVGERVGRYALTRFDTQDNGETIAVLQGVDGKRYTLAMGCPLPQPGQVVCLTSLENGGWIYTRPGETFQLGGSSVTVQLGETNQVSLLSGTRTLRAAALTEPEKAQLQSLWAARKREAEAAAQVAHEKAAAARKQQRVDSMLANASVPRPEARRRTYPSGTTRGRPRQSGMNVGTEYRYPIEYDIVPVTYTCGKTGQRVTRPVTVPTRFTTRSVSFNVNIR
ncbi:MAG: hypothetical protein QGG69_01570 [Kiritimatiellia bacterium]|nr:hypothetical protein [Kiritimatiellia bacterium]